eukprot:m.143019 g.143019  ORF g.143019 m.143019 type:complete len:104 (+) comp17683_c0_seq2:39-350(+)
MQTQQRRSQHWTPPTGDGARGGGDQHPGATTQTDTVVARTIPVALCTQPSGGTRGDVYGSSSNSLGCCHCTHHRYSGPPKTWTHSATSETASNRYSALLETYA